MTVEIPQGSRAADAPRPLRVLLADDHEMYRVAMRVALAPLGAQTQWLEADSADATIALLEDAGPVDLALLDLHMPGADGLPWIARLRQRFPHAPLVVVSADERAANIQALIELGVAGFIPKSDSAAVILQAVRLVLSGGTYVPLRLLALSSGHAPSHAAAFGNGGDGVDAPVPGLTPRQDEVLRLLAQGYPNKLIARDLGLSEGTVKVHLLAIYRVLNARNRTAAVVAAQKWLQAAQVRPR
jgi:DNA-binding NarL/FixJ family response regulator